MSVWGWVIFNDKDASVWNDGTTYLNINLKISNVGDFQAICCGEVKSAGIGIEGLVERGKVFLIERLRDGGHL